jgi:hypothetical protein
MEVLKTHVGHHIIHFVETFDLLKALQVAANRSDNLRDAVRKTWARGGVFGFYQGLIPWVN